MSDAHHNPHPTHEELVEALMLPPGDQKRSRIEALAATDPAMGAQVRMLRATLGALESARLTAVPGDVRARAGAVFEAHFAAVGQRPAAFIAQLLSDSRTGQFTHGLRGVGSAYRLSFSVLGTTLEVQITEIEARPGTDEGGMWRLRAKAENPEALRGARVTARRIQGSKSIEQASATVDDSGHFVLKLPSGLYDIELTGSAGSALLQGVEVG